MISFSKDRQCFYFENGEYKLSVQCAPGTYSDNYNACYKGGKWENLKEMEVAIFKNDVFAVIPHNVAAYVSTSKLGDIITAVQSGDEELMLKAILGDNYESV